MHSNMAESLTDVEEAIVSVAMEMGGHADTASRASRVVTPPGSSEDSESSAAESCVAVTGINESVLSLLVKLRSGLQNPAASSPSR